jgi:hypothetical protein
MNKAVFSTVLGVTTVLSSFGSQAAENIGVGVDYGLISGPTLELTYPINDLLQVRGALSSGMGLTETTSDTNVDYDVKADGGVHRLALDYHPFAGSFFLSAGYAFNDFKLNADGTGTGTVTVGNEEYTGANITLNGQLDWDSAPTLSLGWGYSPAEGWGAMFEVGAIFTGAPDVNLDGSGTYDGGDITSDPNFQQALKDEEAKLQNDVGDYDFLPVLQAGVTYRF